MGLDMYLESMPKIDDYSFEELIELNNVIAKFGSLDSINKASSVPPSVLKHVKNVGKHFDWYSLSNVIVYWRKANQIHNWFVNYVQNGEDDCGAYQVTKDNVFKLLEDVTVLGAEESRKWVAQAVLPTQCGFFFGSTEYDEWYYQDLKETKVILEEILKTFDFKKNYLFYQSCW